MTGFQTCTGMLSLVVMPNARGQLCLICACYNRSGYDRYEYLANKLVMKTDLSITLFQSAILKLILVASERLI